GLTITSTFTENYADNGGAIAVFKDATITESTFTNNTADNYGGAVYVNGSAKLDITKSAMKNNSATVGSSIYSNGTIGSTIVNATILDNKTWNDTGLGKIYVLNATLTDDMGNSIYDPNFRFTVDGTVIADEPSYDDETGLYTLDYVVEKAGLNVISTSYNAANLQVFTGALDIPLANVTEFTVKVESIVEGENATVFITLIGVNDVGLDSIVTLIVNNKEYAVGVVNGTGNITIEDLTHGQYPVVAMFEDPNYESAINSTVFYVKGQAVLNITEITVAEYGDEIEITINLTDSEGNPLSGVVAIDDIANVLVEEGIGTFVIDTQPNVGNYTFMAVYGGDEDYFGDSALFNVNVTAKVIDPEDIFVEVYDTEFGDNITVTVNSPVDGTYTVNVNGTSAVVEVVNGMGSVEIPALDKAGTYNATVDIDDDNYSLETVTSDDFKYMSTPDFNVTITGTYPNAEIVIGGTDGNYFVYIDEDHQYEITVKDGVGNQSVSKIFAGDHIAEVTFYEQNGYCEDYKYVDFTIDKASITEFTVNVESIVKGENATVFVTLIGVNDTGLDSIVTVIVDNKEYDVLVINGAGNTTIENLAHGQYTVVAMFEDPNYESAINSTVFYVKGQAVLNITEITVAEYGDEIEITINLTDSEGNPLSGVVAIDDIANVLVEEGIGTFVIDTQPNVGNYTFMAVYGGDEDYFGDSALFNVNVTAKVIDPEDIFVEVYDTEFGDNITVTVNSPVDGTYTVNVNGTSAVVEVVNGMGSVEIPALDKAGTYNATVDIDDDNYSLETVTSDDFKYMSTPDFNVTITGTYPNAEIVIGGTDGNYFVYIDEDHQYEITVKDGVGSQNVSKIFAGDHVAEVTFYEQNGYYEDYQDVDFTVAKATLTIEEPEVIGDKVIGSQINITFTLPTDVDRSNVSAFMDGVPVPVDEFIINETTGVYTLVLEGFPAAEGHFFVVQVNDPNYEENMTQVSFTIEKINPTLDVSDATGEWNKSIDIPIKLTAADGTPIAGDVIVTVSWDVDGVTQVVRLNETGEGVATFAITEALGDLTVTAKYYGDDTYYAVEKTATLTITEPMEAKLVVVVDSQVPYNDTVYVNVNLTNVRDVAIENATITYSVDGGEVQTAKVDEDGFVSIPVTGLAGGKHTIEVTFNNESYSNSPVNESVTVTVTPIAPLKITSNATENAKVGENVTITITAPGLTGNFTVTVDSELVAEDLPVIDGVAIINVTGLAAGRHSYEVTYNGDENYTVASDANSFDVVQVPTETALNVTIPENTTTPVFSVNLSEDATGYLLVDVDGEQYYAPLVNGSATIQTAPLAGGNHTVTVTYTGDDKYAGFSNTTNMTIDSNVTADTALDVPASSENTPTFSVNLPSDATGFLTVDVDGKKYAAVVENGKASISVPGLSEGNHNVTVIYSGDAKYPTLTKDATVNVHIPVYKITQNKNINVVYSAKATYKVLITKDGKAVGAGESVTIKYNGKTYTVKTDSKGYATFKPTTKVKVKKYTITATYKGVTVKNTVKVKHLIKASNKKIKKSKKVNKIKVKTYKVNGKYLKGKKLTLKIKGKKVKAKINKKGVATFKLKKSITKKLKAGKKYKYTVTYGKDKVTKKVKVKR
ncbi:MAG: Ig-like domain repeat protein, partial [Methanobrevibacter sp.]|nr:Ig-like domain repeat protein [Methanobrevibacter sp.]